MNISKYFENTDELFDGLEDMSMESVVFTMENAALYIREMFEVGLGKALESATYPCYGYTTAQVMENEDEYEKFLREDFEEQLAEWLASASDYAETTQSAEDTKIIVVADERFGDTYVFVPEQLSSVLMDCSQCFGEDFVEQDFIDACEHYDLSDKTDREEFGYHAEYILKHKCWTEQAEAIIIKYYK